MSTTIPSITDSTSTYPDPLYAMTLMLEQQTAEVRRYRHDLEQTQEGDFEFYPLRYAHRAARSALRLMLMNARAFEVPINGKALAAADSAAEHGQ